MSKKVVGFIVGSLATTGVFFAPVAVAAPYPPHCPIPQVTGGFGTSGPYPVQDTIRNPGNCNWGFRFSDGSQNVMEWGPGGWRYGRVCPGEHLPPPNAPRYFVPGQCK